MPGIDISGYRNSAKAINALDNRETRFLADCNDLAQGHALTRWASQVQLLQCIGPRHFLDPLYPHRDFFIPPRKPGRYRALKRVTHLRTDIFRCKAESATSRRHLKDEFLSAIREIVVDGAHARKRVKDIA